MLAWNNPISVEWDKNLDKSICLKLYSTLCEADKKPYIVRIFYFEFEALNIAEFDRA